MNLEILEEQTKLRHWKISKNDLNISQILNQTRAIILSLGHLIEFVGHMGYVFATKGDWK